MGVSDTNMQMNVVVPIWAIVGIVIFSALTIFISSFVPSRKASNITPIDAIKQSSEIKVKSNKLKSPKIIRKVFGYEGELAYKNLKRNGRKSKVIVTSIALSIILFLSCNYFCQMFVQANNIEESISYQVYANILYDQKDELYDILDNTNLVDKYYSVSYYYSSGKIEINSDKDKILTSAYKNLLNSNTSLYINQLTDEEFNKLCSDNNIDYTKYYGDDVKVLLMNNINHKNNGADVFTDDVIGATYQTGQEENGESSNVIISDFINYDESNTYCNLNPSNSISMYVPISTYYSVFLNYDWMNSINISIGIETTDHEQLYDYLIDEIQDNNSLSGYVYDNVDTLEVMNTMVFVIQVLVYGFIALITLITIANIINTISTGIALRRKEFAMLKSVGATPKGFTKMICLESAFYGIKAVVFGIPISILLSVVMNLTLGDNSIPFQINWLLYLAVILVVFAIISISMFSSVSALKNDSVIETLKEDIL
jgi:putative ABC transport system permease protein